MDRLAYTLRRLAQLVPVALGVTLLTFLLIHLLPGDPAGAVLGTRATPQLIDATAQAVGARPLAARAVLAVPAAARRTATSATRSSTTSGPLDGHRAPPVTLWLLVYSTVLAMLIAVPLATVAARRKDGAVDQVVRAVPIVGLGMPAFWLGIMLILLLPSSVRKVFPVGGYGDGRRRAPRAACSCRPDGRHRHRPAADPQPAREPARRARVRLRHHGARQGPARAARAASATRCATGSCR